MRATAARLETPRLAKMLERCLSSVPLRSGRRRASRINGLSRARRRPGPENPAPFLAPGSMLSEVNGHDGLIPYGWDDRVAARLAAVELPDGRPARVIAVHRGACTVTTGEGEQRARGRVVPAVGDWVSVRENEGEHTLLAIAERWSAVTRRDPEGLTQVLAANVDIVFVTTPADRLSPTRVERETVMAWDSGARPIVLLAKSDLATSGQAEDLRNRLVGVDVIPTSTVTDEGIETVRAALRPARTAVLLGPSGAGKSSLANVLLGDEQLATGAVRPQDRRGRHTTTARQLLVVPTGGLLIDTPGLRSLSLTEDHGGVAAAFPDIEAIALECRFNDCRHDQEPGCALLAAVDAERWAGSAWPATGSWPESASTKLAGTTHSPPAPPFACGRGGPKSCAGCTGTGDRDRVKQNDLDRWRAAATRLGRRRDRTRAVERRESTRVSARVGT